MSIFSQRLKDLIFQNHKDVKSFAKNFNEKRINGVTITPAAISNILNKDTECKYPLVIAFAQYFNVPADYLLGLTDTKTTDMDLKQACERVGIDADLMQKFNKINTPKSKKGFMAVINYLLFDFNDTYSFYKIVYNNIIAKTGHIPEELDLSDLLSSFPRGTILEDLRKCLWSRTIGYEPDNNEPPQYVTFDKYHVEISFDEVKQIFIDAIDNDLNSITIHSIADRSKNSEYSDSLNQIFHDIEFTDKLINIDHKEKD